MRNNSPFTTLTLIASMSLAMFTVSYNSTAIMNILVIMREQLHLSVNGQQWAANIYMVLTASFIIVGSQISDRFGRRRIFITAAIVFAIASVIIACAHDLTQLLIGRAFQGIAAAFIAPGSLAILKANLPPEKIGRGISTWTAAIGLGLALGPTLGGVISELSSWRMVFAGNLLFLTISVALIRLLTCTQQLVKTRFDKAGLILLIGGLLPIMTALMQTKVWGLTSPLTLSLLFVGSISLVTFAVVELRIKAPLIRFSHFKNKHFLASNLSNATTFFAVVSILFFFNIYFQNISLLNFTPLEAGLALLPLSLAMFTITFFIPTLIKTVGYKRLLSTSMLVMALSLFWFSFIDVNTHYLSLVPALTLLGTTVGIALSASPALGLSQFEAHEASEASGILNTSNYLAAVLAVAIGGILFQWGNNVMITYITQTGELSTAHLQMIINSHANTLSELLAQFPANFQDSVSLASAELPLEGFKFVMFFTGLLALFSSVVSMRFIKTK